jgi:hypothetical protein
MIVLTAHTALSIICLIALSVASPSDLLLGREYHGQYIARQPGVELYLSRKHSATWMSDQDI